MMKTSILMRSACASLLGLATGMAEETTDEKLWSDQPVIIPSAAQAKLRTLDQIWSKEVFPIGNGRLGCTVFGGPKQERIQFNEDSLWVGNEDRTGGYQPFGDLQLPSRVGSESRRADHHL